MKINQIKLEGARIVKFEPKYAASIADMWNASAEGWNGDLWNMTEQLVLNEETRNNYISSYLLIDDQEKVIGYCKLEEYRDKKAVYIALLNVIPLFWGKKYGKALLLKAIQKTINSGYNRLDLHSWSGNTKAVPLYKKAGFRWQTANSSMYMMNYLPYLSKLEILKPYFDKIDWYDDCVCDNNLEPDGVMERGFELIHYKWKKDDLFLEAIFNIDAKGLNYLNCNDFELKLDAPKLKTCYGSRNVFLEMTNKSSEPLSIEISMSGEAEITISEKRNIVLTGHTQETFKISVKDDIERGAEEIPSVTANLLINGKPVTMKLGLKPQAPVAVVLKHEYKDVYQPGNIELFLQLRNNLKEAVKVNLKLADISELSFAENSICTDLKAKEIKTVSMPTSLKKGCFYDQKIKVHLQSDDENISYTQKIRCEIADLETLFHSETDEYWSLRKGKLKLKYSKKAGYYPLYIDVGEKSYWFIMMPPKLSEPYVKEFANQLPDNASFTTMDNGVGLRVEYKSKNKKFKLSSIFILRNDKVITHDWEIENISGDAMDVKHLETNFDFAATQAIYDGKLLDMTPRQKNVSWNRLSASKVTSGWMFYDHDGFSAAVSWNKDRAFSFGEWWQIVAYEVGVLQPGQKKHFKGETMLFNTFKKWQDFYSWKFGNKHYPDIIKTQQLVINDGNPFCDNEVALKYIDLNDSVDIKDIRLYGDDGLLVSDKFTKGTWSKKLARNSRFKLELEEEAKIYSFEQMTFAKCQQPMQFSTSEHQGLSVSVLTGEKLVLKTSPDFMNGIFSIKYLGKELLSSSFPKDIVRGWANHWHGGFQIKPNGISATLLKKQKVQIKEETRRDNYNNVWQGFSYTVKYDEGIKYIEGFTIRYSFLVSPSQDIICAFNEIISTGGAFEDEFWATTSVFINEDQPVRIKCKDTVLKVSERSMRENDCKMVSAKLLDTNYHLNFFSPQNSVSAVVFSNMGEVTYESLIRGIKPGEVKASQQFYLYISERKMSVEELQVLKSIKWS